MRTRISEKSRVRSRIEEDIQVGLMFKNELTSSFMIVSSVIYKESGTTEISYFDMDNGARHASSGRDFKIFVKNGSYKLIKSLVISSIEYV